MKWSLRMIFHWQGNARRKEENFWIPKQSFPWNATQGCSEGRAGAGERRTGQKQERGRRRRKAWGLTVLWVRGVLYVPRIRGLQPVGCGKRWQRGGVGGRKASNTEVRRGVEVDGAQAGNGGEGESEMTMRRGHASGQPGEGGWGLHFLVSNRKCKERKWKMIIRKSTDQSEKEKKKLESKLYRSTIENYKHTVFKNHIDFHLFISNCHISCS